MLYIDDFNFGMLQVSENENSLCKWSGGPVHQCCVPQRETYI